MTTASRSRAVLRTDDSLTAEGGRSVWLSYRMSLLQVQPENARSAAAEEMMARGELLQELSEMNQAMAAPQGQQAFYELI